MDDWTKDRNEQTKAIFQRRMTESRRMEDLNEEPTGRFLLIATVLSGTVVLGAVYVFGWLL